MEELREERHTILQILHPNLRKYAIYIWQQSKFGDRNISILRPALMENEKYSLNFKVSIPYTGRFVQWRVIFSEEDMRMEPRIYSDTYFVGEMTDVIFGQISSWARWNYKKPNALYKKLLELLILYKHNEIQKLMRSEEHPRLQEEFLELVRMKGIQNVEILNDLWGAVHLYILLDVDFLLVPSSAFESSEIEPKVALMMTFHGTYFKNVQTSLKFTPRFEYYVSKNWSHFAPLFPYDGHLTDYVLEIEKYLRYKIDNMSQRHMLKPMYIGQLLANYKSNVLEYDSVDYLTASLLFETNNIHWMVKIEMGHNFPRERPAWILRSIYSESFISVPLTQGINYPYSPKWTHETMIKTALEYTIKTVNLQMM